MVLCVTSTHCPRPHIHTHLIIASLLPCKDALSASVLLQANQHARMLLLAAPVLRKVADWNMGMTAEPCTLDSSLPAAQRVSMDQPMLAAAAASAACRGRRVECEDKQMCIHGLLLGCCLMPVET